MEKFKKCSKQEHADFLAAYPKPLDFDVFHAYEPPLQTWNDFSDGKKWPESVVAIRTEIWGADYKPTGESEHKVLA